MAIWTAGFTTPITESTILAGVSYASLWKWMQGAFHNCEIAPAPSDVRAGVTYDWSNRKTGTLVSGGGGGASWS